MKKIAVVLSGCGVFDGAEIHEATLTLYAIASNDATYEIFAPDKEQHHVVNHMTGEEMNEKRNVLVESARIARGKISPLSDFEASGFDGLIFPGGFGVAKNLSDWALMGPDGSVDEEVDQAIRSMVEAGKPVGALCISPVLLAKTLEGAKITVGSDPETVTALKKTGAIHVETTHTEVVVDEKYNIITTPCYMLDASIVQIAEGAMNVVRTMLKRMK